MQLFELFECFILLALWNGSQCDIVLQKIVYYKKEFVVRGLVNTLDGRYFPFI